MLCQSGTTIELVNIEDSRCPSDVTCVWAGDANVFLKIISSDTIELFNLHTIPNMDDHVSMITLLNHEILLLDVRPYPTSTQGNLALTEYVLDLTVNRL